MKNFATVAAASALFLTLCPRTAGAQDVSPQMKDFLSGFAKADEEGKPAAKKVQAALKKFGSPTLDASSKSIGSYGLKDPKVTSSEKKEGKDCYTVKAAAGMVTRGFVACWAGGKIVKVEDKGILPD